MKHKLSKKMKIGLGIGGLALVAIIVGSILIINNNTAPIANNTLSGKPETFEANIDISNKIADNKKGVVISTTAEVQSALTESLETHATYYLEEVYAEENQALSAGENILKYTNGEYMTMPYDGVITKLNVANVGEQCDNSHSVQISSTGILKIQVKVDETKINRISLGDSATITIDSIDSAEIEGVVTNISNTASNGKFTVTIEFENNGKILLGMTANVEKIL